MGSLATSEMIFFIATLVLSISVVGVLGGQTAHLALGMENSAKGTSNLIQTDFQIINDPTHIPHSSSGYAFYIKNTGETAIFFTNQTVSVLINGTLMSGSEVSMNSPNGTGELIPGQVGTIMVNITIGAGYNQITVTLSNGLSKNLEFKI
ncbi:MAG: flagellar protein G [Candidatus Thermoplasmatota archaeon]|nr:flagellar protein G [Candidatus Thermoplasmatota archaeon]MDA8143591.1 flagellar protein G [Thermoplasmatales archaeon]